MHRTAHTHARHTQPKFENGQLTITPQYSQHHELPSSQAQFSAQPSGHLEHASDMAMDWEDCDADEEADVNNYYA